MNNVAKVGVIETVSGKFVNVLDPDPSTISLDDIAWSISRIARFAGHTVTTVPYVVGQHCIFVADLLIEAGFKELAPFGLLHDGGEGYIGDIPSPVKHIPEIKTQIDEVEDRILHVIFDKFIGRQATKEEWDVVKYYDKKAQFIEAHAFMCSRGMNWFDRKDYDVTLVDIQTFPPPKQSIEVYKDFRQKYTTLTNKMI